MYNPIEIQKVTKSGAHSVTLSRINHLQLMTMAITLPSGAGFLRDAGQHDAEDCHGAPAGSAAFVRQPSEAQFFHRGRDFSMIICGFHKWWYPQMDGL